MGWLLLAAFSLNLCWRVGWLQLAALSLNPGWRVGWLQLAAFSLSLGTVVLTLILPGLQSSWALSIEILAKVDLLHIVDWLVVKCFHLHLEELGPLLHSLLIFACVASVPFNAHCWI